MSRGRKASKEIPGLSLEVKDRTPQDLIRDLAEFQLMLDRVGAGAPRCIADGCSRKVIQGVDPYYCGEHRPQ